MLDLPDAWLDAIRSVRPSFDAARLVWNREGGVHDVVIVDEALVFRFPKHPWGRASLSQEARILDLVRERMPVSVPVLEVDAQGFSTHAFLPGTALTRLELLQRPPDVRRSLLEQVVGVVAALHEVPLAEVEDAGIGPSNSERDLSWWGAFYEDVRAHLFPHLMAFQRDELAAHFEPVLSGALSLEHEPRLVHADLAPYHLLFDPPTHTVMGILDFGTGGVGDPAVDVASLLYAYGESQIAPLLGMLPDGRDLLDRARFWAGELPVSFALAGLRRNDPAMALAHLGFGAPDLQPPGRTAASAPDAAAERARSQP